MTSYINTASGRTFDIPMFDPVVANHFSSAASYTDSLLHQINEEKIYAPIFAGRGGLTFLDIGANIGLVSLYAADSCARIVAVEPAPQTFDVLKAMVAGRPNIEPVCAALSPQDGPCEFFQNDLNSTASSTVNTYGTRTEVAGYTLPSLLNIYQLEHVDICKIDAEGAEGESLTFAVLEQVRPIIDSYYIETHNCPKSTWQEKLGRLVQDLSRLGYYRQIIDGMTLWAKP